jgi:hypothetical protein
MASLAQLILAAVEKQPGITDRRLAEALFGAGTPQQRVNGECRRLADQRLLQRAVRPDGLIGNYCLGENASPRQVWPMPVTVDATVLSEDWLKTALKEWLEAQGWEAEVAWGRTRGIDLHARRGRERWIIEAKGRGSLDPMRVNYFLCVMGETLQRMTDSEAAYSIALPDMKQFRNLWARLPPLAKQRTQITALFVSEDGKVTHVMS